MKSGRERYVAEIVRFKKAALVGRLLLGELGGPMEAISEHEYWKKPRKELVAEREKIRSYLRGEVARFCLQNFVDLGPEGLSELYDVVFTNGSSWRVSLVDFVKQFGQFREGKLGGAPLHVTVDVSPWGLKTEFPETLLIKDLAVAFNEAVEIEEHRLTPYRTMSWAQQKEAKTRPEIADLVRRRDANQRACVLACFNLIEAYVNGLAWDYVQTHDISGLTDEKQNVLMESKGRLVNIEVKLIKIPAIVAGTIPGPLHQTQEPMKSFLEIVKPYRDAIVHASPFSAPLKFGGYDKLSKLYGLDMPTVRTAVQVTISMIGEIYRFVGGAGQLRSGFCAAPKMTDSSSISSCDWRRVMNRKFNRPLLCS